MTEFSSGSEDNYQVGGSLPADAPSYVRRASDDLLYDALRANKFCYVLNSRQMGKSSLKVQTIQRLQSEGVACAAIDLTRIGAADITAEQWYSSVIDSIVGSLDLYETFDLYTWWEEHRLLSNVRRLDKFIEEILLTFTSQKIVIFIDEIDSVIGLPFKLGDFFALVRECYNRRANHPDYARLTFVLLGVTTLSDLMQGQLQTPFNIGQEIALEGFQLDECESLVQGLAAKSSNPQVLMQAILTWTGGQPFLTQKVCKLVLNENSMVPDGQEEAWVADLVRARVIENWEAQDTPEHLKTIRDRVLYSGDEKGRGRLLGLYQQVLDDALRLRSATDLIPDRSLSEVEASEVEASKQSYLEGIPTDDSYEQMQLRLTGLVVKRDRRLVVYNLIYATVFNQSWCEQSLADLRPDFYAEAFKAWQVETSEQEESFLLRGQALEIAETWAKDKRLSDEDEQFLRDSRNAEKRNIQLALTAEKEANEVLSQAQRKANKRILFSLIILSLSLLGAAIATVFAGQKNLDLVNAQAQLNSIQAEKTNLEQQKNQLQSEKNVLAKQIQDANQSSQIAIQNKQQAEKQAEEARKAQKEAELAQQSSEANFQQVNQDLIATRDNLDKSDKQAKEAIKKAETARTELARVKQEQSSAMSELTQVQSKLASLKPLVSDLARAYNDKSSKTLEILKKVQETLLGKDNTELISTSRTFGISQDTSNNSSIFQEGAAFYQQGKLVQSAASFQQILTISRKNGDRKTESQSLNNLGLVYYSLGQLQKAIDFYQQSLVISREIKDRQGEGKILGNLGNVYRNFGDYDKAIDYQLQNLSISREIKDRQSEGSALGNLGIVYYALGNYDKAIDYQLQNLSISREIKDRQSEGSTLGNLGIAYYAIGKYEKALELALQSLTIVREIKDKLSEGLALGNLGIIYNAIGKYEKAIEYQQQRLAIARESGDRLSESRALGNLGVTYGNLGKYDKAIDYNLKTLTITREIKDRQGEGKALKDLGITYSALGEYIKATDYYLQALAIAREIKDRQSEGSALGNLGVAYNALGKYDKATDYYLQALAIAREIKDRQSEGSALGNLGVAYNALGKYDKATDYYLQALAIAREIKDRQSEGSTLDNLGVTYANLGKYDKATEYHLQALAIAREIKDRRGESISLSNIGSTFTKQRQPDLAIIYYKQSINVQEDIRKDIRGLSKEEQKSYLNTVNNTYRNLADLLLERDRILEAKQVLDLLKVQEFSDYVAKVNGSEQKTANRTDLLPSEQNIIALGNEISALQRLDRDGKLDSVQKQRLAYLTSQERDLNRQFIAFLDSPVIQKQLEQIRSVTRQQNVNIEEFNRLRESLSQVQNAALFYPLILEDRLELILITATTPPIRKTININRKVLNAAIEEFRTTLQDPNSFDVKQDGKKFYDWLIKPFEKELQEAKVQTIIYSPDAQLRYIPLAALYDGKQWLIEKYLINNLTANNLSFQNSKPLTNIRLLAGAFGGKQGERRFGQVGLPGTILEVSEIAKLIKNSTVLVGNNFSRLAFETQSSKYNILHLATPFYFVLNNPQDSFILFGNGDKATLSEFRNWDLRNVDLIVLSDSETFMGGRLGNGLEILGLGYNLLSAGAKASISSLWKISDSGTQVLMEEFYSNLQKGNMSISASLREAQVSMIRRHIKDRYNHPYYWSAFVLIGNDL